MMREAGVIYLEFCFVVILLAIFLLLSFPPLVFSLQKQQSQLFMTQLASDLMYTSNLSRTEQTVYYLQLLPFQKQYLIYSPFRSFQKKGSIPTGLRVSSNLINNRVTYNGNGQISQGGTIYVKDQQGRTCQFIIQLSSGRFRTICEP